MSLNYNNLCDDWGWYIDLENYETNNEKNQFIRIQLDNCYRNKNYDDHYRNNDDIIEYLDNVITKHDYIQTALNIGTTIIITIILTYTMSFPINVSLSCIGHS